jgi:hypothetical protein
MFYFKINRIKICDNKENPQFLFFGRDVAQVKLISFIATENSELPDVSEFLLCNDAVQKKALLGKAIESVIAARIFTEIDNVKDNHIMTFGSTGFVLYKSEKIPDDIDWQFIAYESDQNISDNAQMVDDIVNDSEFGKFTDNITSLLSRVPNPSLTAAVAIAKFAVNVITKVAKQNHDDLIGILYTSLNRRQHYPYGERRRDRVPDLTNNMFIDYSIFGFDE